MIDELGSRPAIDADRPAIIGREGVPSNAILTGTRWVTLTQLPVAFCAGSSENCEPVPAPMPVMMGSPAGSSEPLHSPAPRNGTIAPR